MTVDLTVVVLVSVLKGNDVGVEPVGRIIVIHISFVVTDVE